jgi:beta-N-acetylhexosaminidase
VEVKAAQMIMVLSDSPAAIRLEVAAGHIGGYALRGEQSPDVARQIAETNSAAPSAIPLIVATDEEGGLVQRLRKSIGKYPSASEVAHTMSPDMAQEGFELFARKIRSLGFTMVLGPVLDLGDSASFDHRCFSADPEMASRYGIAVIEATRRANLVPVAKHWPGIGRRSADSHWRASVLPDIADLREHDLIPWRNAISRGLPALMVSHEEIPGLTDGPASLSSAAMRDELRGREHFEGVILVDALDMKAAMVGNSQSKSAEAALAAGADIAMLAGNDDVATTHALLVDAILTGRLSLQDVNRSVARVLALKGIR